MVDSEREPTKRGREGRHKKKADKQKEEEEENKKREEEEEDKKKEEEEEEKKNSFSLSSLKVYAALTVGTFNAHAAKSMLPF